MKKLSALTGISMLIAVLVLGTQPVQANTSTAEPEFCVYEGTNYQGRRSCLPESNASHSPGGPVIEANGGTVRSISNHTNIAVCLKWTQEVRHRVPARTSQPDINVTANGMWFAPHC